MADLNSTETNYSIPVPVPGDLMNKLIALSTDSGKSLSDVCGSLILKAVNIQSLSDGIIEDISEQAQDIIKTLSMDATLEALRLYNVSKAPAADNKNEEVTVVSKTDLLFNTTTDVIDLVKQINTFRATKGLAPLEKSICEVLYHYGLSLGDLSVCEKVTGIPETKFKAITKTFALNERDVNAAQTNIIEPVNIFGKYTIVDTPAKMPPPPPAFSK